MKPNLRILRILLGLYVGPCVFAIYLLSNVRL
jgi:hypothetical protein